MPAAPNPQFMTLRMLWAALFSATLIYLGVLQVIPARETAPAPMLVLVLVGTAIATAVMSFILPRHLLRAALAAAEVETTEIADQNAQSLFRDAATMVRVFEDSAAARRAALVASYTPSILRFALSEAVALYGFVLAFLGAELTVYLPLFLISWVLFGAHFPARAKIDKALEDAKGARFRDA